MKKQYIILPLVACLLWASVASCGGKGGNKENAVDEKEEAGGDEADDEVVNAYLSQDLATFDLRGQVSDVAYKNYRRETYLHFDRDGRLAYMCESEGGRLKDFEVERNGSGQIERLWSVTDEPWMNIFGYNRQMESPSLYVWTNMMGNNVTYTYSHDSLGRVSNIVYEESVHSDLVDESEIDFSFNNYDEQGNWRDFSYKVYGDDMAVSRSITYYSAARKGDDEEAREEKMVKDFIVDMYDNDRYMEYEFLEEHCTDGMLKFLKESYEYDGEGYAVWLFRSSNVDGNPDAEDRESRVLSVTKKDGWYHYQYNDCGWKGENRMRCFVFRDQVWISNLESVNCETYGEE